MKKLLSILTAVLVVSSMISPAFARGIFVTPGAEANSVGGAFVAIADDATAIYWNPAGLANQQSSTELSATYISGDAKSNVTLQPGLTSSQKFATNALLPFMASVINTKSGISVAAGAYAAGGGGGKYSDPLLSVIAAQSFMIYNVSAAKEVSKGLKIGIGVDMVNMQNNIDVVTTIPDYPFEGDNFISSPANNVSSGYGVQFNGGVLYDILNNLTGGFSIKSGTTIKLSGTNFQATQSGLGSGGDFTNNYSYPLASSLGFAYKPIDKLMVAASVEWTHYSCTQDPNTGANWTDMTQYHIGAEYQLCDKWSVSLGFMNEPAEANAADYLSLVNTNQYNLYSYVAGVGYKAGAWKLKLESGYTYSDTLQNAGITYQYNFAPVRFDVAYAF